MALKIRHWLACGVAFVALPNVAQAQQGAANNVENVVVTGSRVISDAANSPTPLTIISADDLKATTPSDIPDGLNKLPIFQGSTGVGRPGDGSHNYSSDTLDLRNFGSQRTLVLLDGHRATPSNDDGTVDVDTLPQMLISRVDIVTGGASAVYGSDAVTGVVNFVLDKKFEGLKIDANTGISTYADAMSYTLGAAAGTSLFGGRGHFEASVEWRHRDPVNQSARPYGPTLLTASNGEAGTGTAANPFNVIANARRPNSTFGGLVQGCVPACPLANQQQFNTAGQLAPFYAGVAGATDANGNPTSGTGNFNSGGDGAYDPYGQVFNGYHQGTLFGRFSYDLADNITFYAQGTAAEAYSFGWYFPQKIQPGINQADIFYKNNPFLTGAEQTQLGNNPALQTTQLSATVQAGNSFQLGEFLVGNGQTEINATGSVNRVLSMRTGFDGTFMNGRFAWNLFYSHGENRLAVDLINNQNLQHMYASEDAVLLPNGTVACYAATQAATQAAYASCVPINPFGANSVSQSAFKYDFQETNFHETNTLNNLGGGISGKVLDGWAGPITAALSGEARFNAYDIGSNVPSSTFVDCTGLRICNPALPSYAQPIIQAVHASQNVWEFALETEVPVIKDVPLIQSFDLNMAGRYTDYSVSGSVQTWKIGFNWNVIDSLRFRGTTSIDIRAPTLDDLFRPPTLVQNVFNGDLHIPDLTKPQVPNPQYVSYTTTFSSQGNPALVPEVARTYTVGAVWTPDFIEGLTVSLDYYRIHLANAIGQIAPSSTIQTLCEASGGTSIYCANYQRPLPFSDHTTANETTRLFTFNLNTASTKTEGWDFETNYAWQMSDLMSDWKGSWNARLLATYEPIINKSVLIPGQPFTRSPDSSTRVTTFLNYSLNDWSFGLEDEWVSGFSQVAGPILPAGSAQASAGLNNWVNPHVNSWNQVDLNISRNFMMGGTDLTGYFVVQNLLNAQPAYVPNGTIGQIYPTAQTGLSGYSVQSPMGRYFTIGLKANL
ncbi:MAG TPA: TonB-dependent receptor [Rhizomicrobium sp.]|nr:TonB-dependent receptor [Rhizomicrobium sp.]